MRYLTAISGLSANTYSCGGEVGRFFFAGGELCSFAMGICLRYWSNFPPWMDSIEMSSSVESADESSERSEDDIVTTDTGG